MIFLAFFLGALIILTLDLPLALVCYLVWKFIILAIFPAWPILTYWQMYGIVVVLSFVGSFFHSKSND